MLLQYFTLLLKLFIPTLDILDYERIVMKLVTYLLSRLIHIPFVQIFSPEQCSRILSNPSDLRDEASLPYMIAGKITAVYILIFKFRSITRTDKKIID